MLVPVTPPPMMTASAVKAMAGAYHAWPIPGAGPICVATLRCSVARDAQRTASTPRVAGSLAPRLARNLPQHRTGVALYPEPGHLGYGGQAVDVLHSVMETR